MGEDACVCVNVFVSCALTLLFPYCALLPIRLSIHISQDYLPFPKLHPLPELLKQWPPDEVRKGSAGLSMNSTNRSAFVCVRVCAYACAHVGLFRVLLSTALPSSLPFTYHPRPRFHLPLTSILALS